jgi:ribose 1,5-bisphosphokinase
VVDAIRGGYADVTVVAITAPPDVLTERLAARARSSDGQIKHRLSRAVATTSDVTIVNVGRVEDHAHELLRVIKGFQRSE